MTSWKSSAVVNSARLPATIPPQTPTAPHRAQHASLAGVDGRKAACTASRGKLRCDVTSGGEERATTRRRHHEPRNRCVYSGAGHLSSGAVVNCPALMSRRQRPPLGNRSLGIFPSETGLPAHQQVASAASAAKRLSGLAAALPASGPTLCAAKVLMSAWESSEIVLTWGFDPRDIVCMIDAILRMHGASRSPAQPCDIFLA